MRLAFSAALLLTACSGHQPSVEEVLASGGKGLQADANAEATRAREKASAEPKNAMLLIDAAAALFLAADLEIRRGVIASLDKRPATSVDDLLGREDELDDSTKARVVALADAAHKLAARAIELEPKSAAARFYYAAGLGLAAWGRGARKALMSGLGTKVKGAIDDAVEADQHFLDAAPLRAQAGFYGRAPWPLGDKKRAAALAKRAVERAPTALNLIYLAEMAWRADDKQAARDAWAAAATAESDPATARSLVFVRELAVRAVAVSAG